MSGFATPPMRRPSPAASSTAPMRNLGYSPPPCLSKHPIILIPSSLSCEGKYVHASQRICGSVRKKYTRISPRDAVCQRSEPARRRGSSPNRRGPVCTGGASRPESVRVCILCRKFSKSGCRSKSRQGSCVGPSAPKLAKRWREGPLETVAARSPNRNFAAKNKNVNNQLLIILD